MKKLMVAALLLTACAPKVQTKSAWQPTPWRPGDPEPETAIVWEDALTNGEQSADVVVCAHADLTLKPKYWFVHIRTWNWRPPTEEEKARAKGE